MTPLPFKLEPAETIRHPRQLRTLVDTLRGTPLLAVDTESNSLYAYYEHVCLIQLSTRERDYIVDPLALDDLSALGEILADPATEIVFHAAEYDIISLKRDFGFRFSRVFDTMLAARICGWPQVGLGPILEEQFGVRAEKKFQRADWSVRPLPAEQLLYAQMDTHYLPALRDRLADELRALGRTEEAREIFAALPDLPPAAYEFDPEGYWRIHGVQKLRRSQVAIVRELYLLRDALARRRDVPAFRIFSDKTLIELAQLRPRRPADLDVVRGLGGSPARRYGDSILDAIARGERASPPAPPRRRRPPDQAVQDRYEALRTWRKERAAERGVESDVIMPRETLWVLAREVPRRVEELDDIPGLGPWRRAEYGDELIALLKRATGEG
ncbi:MAG: HRDC domain-containing protein [Chloroflexota bacterium]